MKRFALILLVVLCFLSVYAQKDEFSPWSFTAESGVSSLDGDNDSYIQPAFGASVEYAFLPFAGVCVDLYHFPLKGLAFSTDLNISDINLTVNINELLFSRWNKNVILKGYLGYGLARYTSKYLSTSAQPSINSNATYTSSFPVIALSVEYHLIKSISLGIKSQFRTFNSNNLEGDPRYNLDNVTTDSMVAFSFYLRFKLYAAN